ncbi:MAG TPA: ATPase, T2SS/T4P/T4SS family [Candidatus Angelobacter sp.]|jgi:type IV pilus assembly protein PilB|nr:ATPase, T2SS/T4P/T4SS family [Candidatus Angelobacter sp.]
MGIPTLLSPKLDSKGIGPQTLSTSPKFQANYIEEQNARQLADQFRIPHIKLAAITIDPDAIAVVPEKMVRQYCCIGIRKEAEDSPGRSKVRPNLVLAMVDPGDMSAIQNVEFSTGCKVKPVVATKSEIEDAIERNYAPERLLGDILKNVSSHDDLKIIPDESGTIDSDSSKLLAPAVKLVNLILQYGIKHGASDIHVEPTLHDLQVRIRVSAIMREFTSFPKWLQNPLISRIKIMAKLDIAERRRPQDGRIKVMLEDRDVDLRVSVLPTQFGEKVVLRILGSGHKVPTTSSLGFKPEDLAVLKKAAEQPQGMILVTGPTGSGKTTTLYSIINEKKDPSINIVTIEDPIEIQLPGINQVQVNVKSGMTFAASMRSLLRQDPDVILLGEIRDSETQEIAFQAALTGHLVLSTLHTNSTAGTITRLLDMGVEPYVISDSVHLIVAQRLLRTICEHCKESYVPPRHLLDELNLVEDGFQFFRGRGCAECVQTGYAGRVGIYELLRFTPTIREMVARRASEPEIRRAAAATSGTSSLLEEALAKVQQGVTTVEEVLRVLELKQEDVSVHCPGCKKAIKREFVSCPFCSFELKCTCRNCDQQLDPEWQICPYCSSPTPAPAVAATPSQPAAAGSAPQAAQPPADLAEISATRHNRFLVVDDVAMNRKLAVKALEKLPYGTDIIEAKDGLEALTAVGAQKPDLLVLDVMMPGMSGFEVCKKLRENVETAFIPILMLTANATEAARTEGYLAGTDDYMAKPFSVPEFHARVARLMRRAYGV